MMRKSYFSFLLVAIVMAMIAVPIISAAETTGGAQRSSRVVTQINENQLVTLGGHVAPWATRANDLGAAPDSMKVDLHLMLKRSDAQEAALQKLLAEQQNPKSANFRKWLTPEGYGARFGISDSDLAKVTAWLTSLGFVVDKVAKASNVIHFTGTNAQVQQALHTALHQFRVGSELHYANASNPMVPAALAPVINGFSGLNDMKPKPMHTTPNKLATRKKGDQQWQAVDAKPTADGLSTKINPLFEYEAPDGPQHYLAPGDFATIYNVQRLYDAYDGTGQTIAVVAQSEVLTRDVDDFRAAFGLPATKLNVMYVGPNPGLWPGGSESEATLDVQWSGAVAKNATIDLVVADDVRDAIFYSVDNDLAPVLSVSWGQCEASLGIGGNIFYSELYKQASSQGITVIVAAGDGGSATCDYPGQVAFWGLSVSGLASTPYNVAVGGTDFPVNWMPKDGEVTGYATDYWNSTNASDLHSAKSYVPEAPWNHSCQSPELLMRTMTLDWWKTDTTNEMLCNDPTALNLVTLVGGGGGESNCIDTDAYNTAECKAGYVQPAWQTGVPGVKGNSRRQIPDVSFFSGAGLWFSAYLFCDSINSGAACLEDGSLAFSTSGGTSFAAPAFAGVVALLNQKTNSRLGNINYTLYDLASKQFNDANKTDACKVGYTSGSDSSCVFNDITQGNIRMPCVAGSIDNPPDGACTVADSGNQIGSLSGYDAGVGFDMATGLGSINAYNLFNVWPDSSEPTQTKLTLTTASSLNYGVPLAGTVAVTAASGAPTGTAALIYRDSAGNTHSAQAAADLVNGAASLSTVALPAGSYKLYARYGGNGVYAASASAEQDVTISPAVTTLEFSAGRTSVGDRQSTRLSATIKSGSLGDYPGGTVTFNNATTGAVIDTVEIAAYTDSTTGYAYAQAFATADLTSLTHGNNQITATFSGDRNYAAATGSPVTLQYTGGFSIAASSNSLTLGPATTSGTVVLTLTPSSGTTLSASSINLSCPGTLPDGVSCRFSPPSSKPDGSVYSTLTVGLSSPLAQIAPSSGAPLHHRDELAAYLGMMMFGGVLVAAPRKRRAALTLCMVVVLVVAAFSFGCGGGSHSTTETPATPSITNTLTVSSTAPALNSPVTLTATVSNRAATGTMSFFDGSKLLGTAAVSNGAASITTSSLPLGTRSLTATYSGDSTYPAAASTAVAVDVTFTTTLTAQAVDATSGNFAQQSVTLTVK